MRTNISCPYTRDHTYCVYKPTLFIVFRAVRPRVYRTEHTSVWYTFERAPKSGLPLLKRKFSFVGAHMPN